MSIIYNKQDFVLVIQQKNGCIDLTKKMKSKTLLLLTDNKNYSRF